MLGTTLADLVLRSKDKIRVFLRRRGKVDCTVLRVVKEEGELQSVLAKTPEGEKLSLGPGTRAIKLITKRR